MRVAVEEDGDEIFTPMPTICPRCTRGGEGPRVVEQGGWMRCEKCGSSYGKAGGDE